MPKFSPAALLKSTVASIASVATLNACSDLQTKSGFTAHDSAVHGAIYHESSADIVNRAPSSMSLPSDPQKQTEDQHTQSDYHFALAETYSLQGDTARAVEEYKLTLVYDPQSAQVRVRLAAEYVKQGLVSEALEQAKAAIEKDPDFADAHILLGGLYSAIRDYDSAVKEYRTVQKANPENFEAPLFVGAILAEQKKYDEAAAQFELLAKNTSNTNANVAWYYLGRVWLEQNKDKNTAKAESAFNQSLKIKPSYLEGTLALGQLFETANHKDKAQKLYQVYQEKYGPSASVAEELSRIYIEAKDYAHAYEQFAIMEAADSNDINIKAKMAFILIEQQRYPEAITRLEDVLALEPGSDKIRFYLGAVYEEVKDFKNAIVQFEKVPIGSSYYSEAIVHSSYLYKVLGNYPKAIETVVAGIKTKDDHAPFYALYASLLDDQKEYRRAAEMLTDAVKKVPDQAQLYFFLGNMQDRIGESDASIASMKKVLDLDKDHIQALNYLAYTYAESGHQLDEAEKMARRATALQPDDGYILDTLGWVMFKRGEVGAAIQVLEAAYKIQPNESVIAEHLGDAYYKNQMPEKAKKLFQHASENESNVGTLEKLRAKITAVDRQIQAFSDDEGARKPASTKTH